MLLPCRKKGLRNMDYQMPFSLIEIRSSMLMMVRGKPEANVSLKGISELYGIKHIIGRVNHPQTNGKVKRLYGAVAQKLSLLNSIDESGQWHNEIKPHMSLNMDELETPAKAFLRKLPP